MGRYPVGSNGTLDDPAIDLPVLPGTYDVVHRRGGYGSGDRRQIWSHEPDYAHAHQSLQRCVEITR